MAIEEPVELSRLQGRDDFLLVCSSFEERCLGALRKLGDYSFSNALLYSYGARYPRTKRNLDEMRAKLRAIGRVKEIESEKISPLESVLKGLAIIKGQAKRNLKISWDISTFTRQHILLFLKGLDIFGLLPKTTLIYTEPKEYTVTPLRSLTYGLAKLSVVPTFEGVSYPSKKSLLIMFLGYEGERALALYELLAPNECILIVPNPPYYSKWKGRTERMNSAIIEAVGKERIRFAHSRNPILVEREIREVLSEEQFSGDLFNYTFCHLGTKPQLVGLYRFVRKMDRRPSILYGSPKEYYRDFYSKEIGRTWVLPGFD